MKGADTDQYTYKFLQAGEYFRENYIEGENIHFYAQWESTICLEDISVQVVKTCEDENPAIGSEVIFTAEVIGCDPENYSLQWQISSDNENWSDIKDATNAEYRIIIDQLSAQEYVRVQLKIRP